MAFAMIAVAAGCPNVFRRLQYVEAVVFALFSFASMSHVQWFLWTRTNAGNANYFYFQTLSATLVFLGFGVAFVREASRIEWERDAAVVRSSVSSLDRPKEKSD